MHTEQQLTLNDLVCAGRYECELRRVDGTVERFTADNLITNEGLNSILNVQFNGAAQITTWYMGVFSGNYTPVAGVTAATITSASTESTIYASATRPEFVEAASTAQSITNSANRASFVFNAGGTIYGAFLVSSNTKSGTGGTLFSAARFGSAKTVSSGDELLLTYTVSAASA